MPAFVVSLDRTDHVSTINHREGRGTRRALRDSSGDSSGDRKTLRKPSRLIAARRSGRTGKIRPASLMVVGSIPPKGLERDGGG
jgi:hypothetical protein